MSSANVQAIHALDEFKAALARFNGDAQGALSATAQEIQRTNDWLAERANYWRNEIMRREATVRQAEAALARCQASGYYDRDGHYHAPDCSAYQSAVLQARVRLREAEAELRNVQQWTRVIQQAIADYQREAQRLATILGNDLSKARALLTNSANILQSYAAVSAPSSAGVRPSPVSSKGANFENWAAENVFRNKRRITVPIELNQHLARIDNEGMGLLKQRSSDNYIDTDGSLWDAKSYSESSTIDRDQLRDYTLMERAGYVIDANGERVPVKSINYLFDSRQAALNNLDFLRGEATVWYVEWQPDGSGIVSLLENQ